jgi:hypothetical protein
MKMTKKEQIFGKLFFDEEMENSQWKKAYEDFSKSKEELEKEKEKKKIKEFFHSEK